MSKMVQMRVNDSEWAVITLGAKQRQMTMTGLLKEAVHFYLSHTPQVEAPKKDKFDQLLEMLDKGPKWIPNTEETESIARFRKGEKEGTNKWISIEEARDMVGKAVEKKENKNKRKK